jgi:hypothetical protein
VTDTPALYITAVGRDVAVYAPHGSRVARLRPGHISWHSTRQGVETAWDADGARQLVDRLGLLLGYWPENPDLDRQRSRVRHLAAELQAARDPDRAGTTAEDAELADLAMSRHVGHTVADVAYLITQAYDHTGDRIVALLLAELNGIIDALLFAQQLTNPQDRIRGHMARIQELRQQLPRIGTPT